MLQGKLPDPSPRRLGRRKIGAGCRRRPESVSGGLYLRPRLAARPSPAPRPLPARGDSPIPPTRHGGNVSVVSFVCRKKRRPPNNTKTLGGAAMPGCGSTDGATRGGVATASSPTRSRGSTSNERAGDGEVGGANSPATARARPVHQHPNHGGAGRPLGLLAAFKPQRALWSLNTLARSHMRANTFRIGTPTYSANSAGSTLAIFASVRS